MTGLLLWSVVGGAAGTVAGGLATLAWLRRRLLVIDVDGISMAPTLRAGERVLVRRVRFRQIQAGHIVLAAAGAGPGPPAPGATGAIVGTGAAGTGMSTGGAVPSGRRLILKRAAAVAGEPVPAALARARPAEAGTVVPAGHLVVLGDNPDFSFDSRDFGYLPGDRVVGVVVRRLGGTRAAPATA